MGGSAAATCSGMHMQRSTISGMLNRKFAFLLLIISFFTAGARAADFTIKKMGEGVYAAIANEGGKAGSNAGFVIGSDGVLVVDTLQDAGVARDLLAEIRKLTNLPIRYVVNTHYHLDHTTGNGVFAEAGATIIAHRNVRGWMRTENLKFFGPTPKPEQKAWVESLVLPNLVYTDAIDLYLGTRLFQVRYMLGHTGGDSVVVVPDANVVFGGDLVWQPHLPNLIYASTMPWIETLNSLLIDHPTATYLSGHGDVATPAAVRDFRNYLSTLRDAVTKAQTAGKSGDELATAVLTEVQPKYGDWGFFKNFSRRNIDQTAAELAGKKRLPPLTDATGTQAK